MAIWGYCLHYKNIFPVSSSFHWHTYLTWQIFFWFSLSFPSKISFYFPNPKIFYYAPTEKKKRKIFWFFVRSKQIKDTPIYQKRASLIRGKASEKRTLENPLWQKIATCRIPCREYIVFSTRSSIRKHKLFLH